MTVKDQLKALMLFIHEMYPNDRIRFIKSFDEGMRCHYCRCKLNYTDPASPRRPSSDHKTPLSKGGSDSDDNIVISCHKCNNIKGDMGYEDFLLVSRPVEHRNKLIQQIHDLNVKVTKLEHEAERQHEEKKKVQAWADKRIRALSSQLKEKEDEVDKLTKESGIVFNKYGGIVRT